MKQLFASWLLVAALGLAQTPSPFTGRWNFNITSPRGNGASWLGIAEKAGALEVMYQPTGGNVFQIKDAKVEGSKLILSVNKATTWELEAKGDKLTGVQKRGDNTLELTGLRAPALNRPMPKNWSKPEPIFNGKDLTGWEPIGNPADSHWTVKDGVLVNTDKGANLKSVAKFDDMKLHFEVFCPEHANSGMYLRGRYEIQLASESGPNTLPDRGMGAIYGRIAPKAPSPKKGEWDVFDVVFVGRTLTVVRNGVTIIDKQEVEGITGGALDANEGEPGSFYIQGDHTGNLKFRNVTISVPKR